MIKLSVIIPVFNCERFIKRCIDKIISEQIDNYFIKSKELEIIVINDGSTDNSRQIVEDIANKQIFD